MKHSLFTFAIFLLSISGFSQSKKGFVFGFATGLANSNLIFPIKNQNHTNLALSWKVGYMINPKLAFLINGAVSIYEYSLSDRKKLRDFGGVFASSQYLVTDEFWILEGIGIGTDAPVLYDFKPKNTAETNYYSGLGVVSSIGYEIYQKKNFALDLQARLNYSTVNLPIGKINGITTALLVVLTFIKMCILYSSMI
ncbi:hypothetical protein [Spirosoma luteum]|uniref:hypothetical protein n=1 Tax=Spirosoma luteum TaxID=431553 RepID=UPI00035F39C2|nr:hypothetical protein [Spirosoma luteum]